jgi:hypothetical protein
LTVTRAQDGTTAQAFTAGDIIEVRPIAELWRERVDKAGDTMTGDLTMSGTGQIKVPSGTTGQRSGSPAAGMVRFNSTLNEFEGYDGTQWASIGGGGGIMSLNDQTTSASFTVPTGSNGISVGPITVASGHTVTVPSGSTWVVI